MVPNQFTVAAVQLNPRLGDLEANLALYAERVRAARAAGAELIVFPELSLTGYFLKDMVSTVALRLDAPEVDKLKELSRGIGLVAGLIEETDDFRFFNSAVYFEDGEIKHVHRKVYLPTYGLFDEGRYVGRGDRLRAFDSKFGRTSLLVCEDMWHPSTVYVAALDHALIVLCPSNSPLRGIRDGQEQDNNARYWELINAMYAQTFSLFIVYANRVGFEDGVGFWGGSEIVGPTGERLAKAKYYDEDLIVAEVNLKEARRQRVMSPLLRDENLDLTIDELIRIRGRQTASARFVRPPPLKFSRAGRRPRPKAATTMSEAAKKHRSRHLSPVPGGKRERKKK
jgi:predicted amidohydrolase